MGTFELGKLNGAQTIAIENSMGNVGLTVRTAMGNVAVTTENP